MRRDNIPDQDAADIEGQARVRLLNRGADALPRPPWLGQGQPPADVDLIRYLLWRSNTLDGSVTTEDFLAGLSLLSPARCEIDQIEAGLLFLARAEGMTWTQIAEGLGLRTGQAAQQRSERVLSRLDAGRQQR